MPTFVVVQPDGRELGRLSGANSGSDLATLYRKALSSWKARQADVETVERVAESRPGTETETETETLDAEASENNDARYKPWESVVRIKVVNNLTGRRMIEFGSGTVIYSTPEESIILTCAHIFHIEGSRQAVRAPPVPAQDDGGSLRRPA